MSKTRMGKRVASLLLSLVMMLSLLPTTVYATGDTGETKNEIVGQATTSGANTEGTGESEPTGEGEDGGTANVSESEDGAATNDAVVEETIAPVNAEGVDAVANAESSGDEVSGEDGNELVNFVTVNGDATEYETLDAAIKAATPDANGVITYTINGKVDVTATGWVQVATAGLTDLTAVKFVGKTADAAIYVTKEDAVLADQVYGNVDVGFSGLTLVKENPTYLNDYAEFTQYFAMEIRATVKTGVVTYTDCKFPKGVINNTYGKTVFTGCEFSNDDSRYNLWVKEGEVELNNGAFTGTRGVKLYNTGNAKATITVKDTTFDGLTGKAAIVVSQPAPADVTLENVTARNCTVGLIQKDTATDTTIIKANGESISGTFNITNAGNAKDEFNISAGTFTSMVSNDYCADGFEVKVSTDASGNTTYGVEKAATAANDGSEAHPYTLAELSAMTREQYITAQTRLGGTMYVTVGNYTYETNGTLGNGTADNSDRDSTKLNYYGAPGAKSGQYSDAAVGKNIVFVDGSITSGVTGYASIDNIGTSLLLAVPAYTNVTFKGTTFNNVMSFNYQLYTSPWSQLGELKFDNCTFNGIIVGAIAAQTLTFNKCEFTNYTNTISANSSNPTWIRPAYGNWTKGDNEGQGSDFRSLTEINFTGNTVTSTRPVKFEYISQWDIRSKVTATGNSFDISAQTGDKQIKNVGLYLGAHTDANAFDLVAEGNTKSENTAALFTIPAGETSLPLGSTVKNSAGEQIKLEDALKWKAADAETGKIVLKTVEAVASIGDTKYASLTEAIAAAKADETVTLLADVTENVEIAANKNLTLDLNGKTLNGGTGTAKAALRNLGTITITDSSEGKTGTIKRDDKGTEGETSYYVIFNQGTMTIESGSVLNHSGYKKPNSTGSMVGSSLICNGDGDTAATLNITGGTLEQKNFIAIKNGSLGTLNVSGGTITSNHSAIQNWFKADITGGEITGQLWTDAYSEGESIGETKIGGDATFTGEIVMDVTGSRVPPTLEITGGELNVTKWNITTAAATAGAKPAISGGEFSSAVPAEYCAPGYVPTGEDADGRFTVAEGEFTVQVTSRTVSSESPVTNVSGGGSNITYAVGTTVTAASLSGYKFVGWFVNEYVEGNEPVSKELSFKFQPTDHCKLIAVYEPISGGKFWLTVTASEFTVNGGAVQDSYLYEQFAVGATVTVNFTGSENFLYWVNASNKVVSTDKSYTFIMGSETTLKAVYGKARQNQATVVFISHSDQIISSKAYTTSDTIQFPVPPIKMGCTFTGWSMTEAKIREAMANNSGIIRVRALYTEPSIACTVTVIYPDGIDDEVVNAVVGKAIDVTAKEIEGKTFSYWTDNAGNILGYTKTLKLAPSGDMTVKAVYGENAEVKPVISTTAIDASLGNGYYVISVTATRAVPEDYELVKQGILYSIDPRCAGDAGKDYLKLTADGTVPEGVEESIGNNKDLTGVTRLNSKVKTADTTLYGRGYMILKNGAGKVLYVYADTILSGSYSSLHK